MLVFGRLVRQPATFLSPFLGQTRRQSGFQQAMRSMAKQPVHETRRGLIKVRVWRKQTRSGTRHSTTVVRLFRNGDVWKESTRFGRDDIPLVCLLLNEAHLWILQNSTRSNHPTDAISNADSIEHPSNSYRNSHD